VVIREVSGGAYPTSLQLHLGDRMLEKPTEVLQMNIDEVNGTCDIDGLGTVLHNDQESHQVTGPVGAMFLVSRLFTWTLQPGADVTGSLLLTVDVGPNPGVFEIDVTCADSEGQLVFRDNFNNPVTPAFSKGIVSVGVVFQDGLESGRIGGWSSVVP
jgi:hypothetical protein